MADTANFQLKVTPAELAGAATKMANERGNINGYMEQIRNIVQDLQGEVWTGADATSFHVRFKTLYDNVQHILAAIQGYENDLTKSAEIYTNAAATTQTVSEGLRTTGVFTQ